jgi:hypothetical protein
MRDAQRTVHESVANAAMVSGGIILLDQQSKVP